MSLLKRLQKRFLIEKASTETIEDFVGKFSDMDDGGTPAEVKDRSVVDIYHFENEENLTPEQWEQLKHLVMLGNPEGEYIASSEVKSGV